MSQPQCNLQKVAQDFIAKHFPLFDPAGLRVVISETGHRWQLTYDLPENMLGGVPLVVIDKRTCAIVHAEHGQ